MSREIKFRAWDKETKQMIVTGFHVFGEYTLFNVIGQYLAENFAGDKSTLERFSDVEVMQFTGLLDKNAVDVYEGDILRWFTIDIEYQTHYGDNIPLGSYTEPCGTLCKKFEMPVVYRDAMFT